MLQAHRLARFEVADLLQSGMVAVLLKLADALHQSVVQHRGLEPKTHNGGDAFGAAHRRNALFGPAGPEQDVTRKHGFKQGDRTAFGLFELFIKRQISIERLLLKVDLGDLLLAGFGVSEVPAIRWRRFVNQGIRTVRILGHW